VITAYQHQGNIEVRGIPYTNLSDINTVGELT